MNPLPVSQIGSTALLLEYGNIVIRKWTTERKPETLAALCAGSPTLLGPVFGGNSE